MTEQKVLFLNVDDAEDISSVSKLMGWINSNELTELKEADDQAELVVAVMNNLPIYAWELWDVYKKNDQYKISFGHAMPLNPVWREVLQEHDATSLLNIQFEMGGWDHLLKRHKFIWIAEKL